MAHSALSLAAPGHGGIHGNRFLSLPLIASLQTSNIMTPVLIIQCLVCVMLYHSKFTSIFLPLILIFLLLRYKPSSSVFCFFLSTQSHTVRVNNPVPK